VNKTTTVETYDCSNLPLFKLTIVQTYDCSNLCSYTVIYNGLMMCIMYAKLV